MEVITGVCDVQRQFRRGTPGPVMTGPLPGGAFGNRPLRVDEDLCLAANFAGQPGIVGCDHVRYRLLSETGGVRGPYASVVQDTHRNAPPGPGGGSGCRRHQDPGKLAQGGRTQP